MGKYLLFCSISPRNYILVHSSQCTMHSCGVGYADYLNNRLRRYLNYALCTMHCALRQRSIYDQNRKSFNK